MKKKLFSLSLLILVLITSSYNFISGYINSLPKIEYEYFTEATEKAPYPDAKFAVLSDIHIYDESLGSTGLAFEEKLSSDRKLLLDSQDLFNFAINEIINSDAQFVLISGDLSKDGELIIHETVAKSLNKLIENGKKVYVIPGNHDINNPEAEKYVEDETFPVENITAEDFSEIYGNFGYNEAIFRDPNSLSYVAEPVQGLWLIAADSCRYSENKPGEHEIVSGKISQASENWLSDVMTKAIVQDKAVMVMMHHGIVEHWKGQSRLHPDYIIQDYKYFSRFLASYNVRLAFTGHYHAQDITRADFDDKYIYDVETGALVTYPCPIRFCALENNVITINSVKIGDILHPGTDFAVNAKDFIKKTVALESIRTLKKYYASDKDIDYVADIIEESFFAHYFGDEDLNLKPKVDTIKLSLWGRFIYSQLEYTVDGIWTDLFPADNNVSFELN